MNKCLANTGICKRNKLLVKQVISRLIAKKYSTGLFWSLGLLNKKCQEKFDFAKKRRKKVDQIRSKTDQILEVTIIIYGGKRMDIITSDFFYKTYASNYPYTTLDNPTTT